MAQVGNNGGICCFQNLLATFKFAGILLKVIADFKN